MHHQSQGANILVVDDEPRMCESLRFLLNSRNFNVRTALNGSDALNWVSSEDFDLVVLDIGLPDMDGIKLLTEIRNRRPDIDVVIITGNATLDSALSAIRSGAFDYLKKPFEYDQLLNTIRNILQQKNLRCENRHINEKLAASEERYRYLVRNSPDIIYILNEDGCFEYINDAVQPLLGYEPQNLIGRHFSEIIVEEDMDSCRWFFQERRTGDRAAKGVELRLKAAENSGGSRYCEVHHLTVELKATGMYEQNGKSAGTFLGTHGVARDVGLRKRLERRLKQAERMEAMGTQVPAKPLDRKIINGTGTVLLVDDEPMIIEVLRDFLEALGYKTITASSGKDAIRLYQDKWKNIDLVILDMVMPEMDGGRVFEALKQTNPDVKAIVASGYCMDGRCKEILREGCKGFIQKPFNLGELSKLIKDVMAA